MNELTDQQLRFECMKLATQNADTILQGSSLREAAYNANFIFLFIKNGISAVTNTTL